MKARNQLNFQAMKRTFAIGLFTLLALFVTESCSNDKQDCASGEETLESTVKSGKVSELALLMREMFEEADSIKAQVERGEAVTINLDHEKILSAHATEPEKVASPKYQAFASSYLESIESLKSAEPGEMLSIYDNMIGNCMACHKSICPGPLVRIKKLQRSNQSD